MSKQTLFGLSVILIIIAGIVFWLYRSPKPAEQTLPADPLVQLFSDVQTDLGLDEKPVPAEVSWNVEVDDETRSMTFSGQELRFQSSDPNVEQTIKNRLASHEFVIDKINVAANTSSRLAGFRKDDQICTLSAQRELGDSQQPIAGGQTAYALACARANFAIEPVVSTEEAVQKLFATKYQTKKSAVAVLIEQEATNHVRGSVRILDNVALDPNAQSGQGTGGIFLAAKVNGNWELVFDGQGAISCELVEGYGFPAEMIKDCSNELAITVAVGEEFTIVLDSNPTTGYTWEAAIDNELVSLIGKEYEAHGAEMLGAGGQEIFTFKAEAAGQASLAFSYLRPWESQQPERERTYQITVTN